jgi:hypothetical protein
LFSNKVSLIFRIYTLRYTIPAVVLGIPAQVPGPRFLSAFEVNPIWCD